jgi:predicted transposase YdaD
MLDEQAELVRNLLASHPGQAFIETTFIYLSWASPLTNSEVIAIFHRISTEAGKLVMSAAQKWINEGIEQGVEQGIEKGIRGMLKLGMDVATIAVAFDVPRDYIDQLIQKIEQGQK